MKSFTHLNQISPTQRKTSEYINSVRVGSGSRKTSIINKNHSNGRGIQYHMEKQNQKINQTQSLLQNVSSVGKLNTKQDQHQQLQKRVTPRENESQKQGYLYKQISPKLVKSADKINVIFVQELTKCSINMEPMSPKSPKLTDSTLFMQEIHSNGVSVKGPQSPTTPVDILTNGAIKNRIPKSVLSFQKNQVKTQPKRNSDSRNIKQYQNTITYF